MTDEQQIRAVLDDIRAAFSRLDIPGWFQSFHRPCLLVLPGTAIAASSVADCEPIMGPLAESLRVRGYAGTQLVQARIQLLSDKTALAGTVWERFDGQDEVFETLGTTYLFVKTSDRWRVAMVTAHAAEIVAVGSRD